MSDIELMLIQRQHQLEEIVLKLKDRIKELEDELEDIRLEAKNERD